MRVVAFASAVVMTLCACNALLEIDDAFLVRPVPEAGPPISPLAFTVPPSLVLDPERPEGTSLHVTLSEATTDAPVSIAITAAPPGISAESIMLVGGQREGDLIVRASPAIASGDYEIVVTADRNGERASHRVAVTVVGIDFGVDDVLAMEDIGAITLGVGVDGRAYGVTASQVVRVVRGKTTEVVRDVLRPPSRLFPATVTADTLYYTAHDSDGDSGSFATCALPLDPSTVPSFGINGCLDGVAMVSLHTFADGDLLLYSYPQELVRMTPSGERRATFALPQQPGEALLLGFMPSGDEVVVNVRDDGDGGTLPPGKVAPDGGTSTFALDPTLGYAFPACVGHGPGELALHVGFGLALVDVNGNRVPFFGDAGVAPLPIDDAGGIGACALVPDGGFYVANATEEAGVNGVTLAANGSVVASSSSVRVRAAFPRLVRAGKGGHFVLLTATSENLPTHLVARVRP